jgi:hypothetical protein
MRSDTENSRSVAVDGDVDLAVIRDDGTPDTRRGVMRRSSLIATEQ